MSKLYEIANEYAKLENSDMDAEMIADTLEGIHGEFEDKAENLLAIVKNESALAEILKAEAKSLSDRAKACENRVKNIKAYMASCIETMDVKSVTAGVHRLSVRKGSQSVQINNIDALPSEFVEYQTTIKPNKNYISEQLKLGNKIEGAELVTGKSSLLVK